MALKTMEDQTQGSTESVVQTVEPDHVSGLKIAADAETAVGRKSSLISNDYFYTKPVAIYNTETGEYEDVSEEDLNDPNYLAGLDPNIYAILFGQSMEDADGFMNVEDYINYLKVNGININDIDQVQEAQNVNDEEVGANIEEEIEQVNQQIEINNDIKKLPSDKNNDLASTMKNMGIGNEREVTFNGHKNAKMHKYFDGSATIYYNEDGTNYWYTYNRDGSLTDVQLKSGDSEGVHYDSNGNIKQTNTVNNYTENGNSGSW